MVKPRFGLHSMEQCQEDWCRGILRDVAGEGAGAGLCVLGNSADIRGDISPISSTPRSLLRKIPIPGKFQDIGPETNILPRTMRKVPVYVSYVFATEARTICSADRANIARR